MNWKEIIKKMVVLKLTFFAIILLYIHKPKIIAITGSVGKTGTKDILYSILKERGVSVGASRGSYNSEFGVPLAIFGLETGWNDPFKWVLILFKAFFKIFTFNKKVLILEIGLEYPGDIYKTLKWLKPNIGVITQLSNVPVHIEHFKSLEGLLNEKFQVFHSTKDLIIYNSEDSIQLSKIDAFKQKKISFGENGDFFITSYEVHKDEMSRPVGMDVVINIEGKNETFFIPGTLGKGILNSLLISIAITKTSFKEIDIPTIRKAVASREPTNGRLRILPGIKNSVLIDDSYNASPIATRNALEVLNLIEGGKVKIVVFGEMAQLGKFTDQSNTSIGKLIGKTANVLITTSPNSSKLAEESRNSGIEVFEAKSIDDAIKILKERLIEDSVVLFKGSQVSRIEKVLCSVLENPEINKNKLVRQGEHWDKA